MKRISLLINFKDFAESYRYTYEENEDFNKSKI